jgi:hypothetical protein
LATSIGLDMAVLIMDEQADAIKTAYFFLYYYFMLYNYFG